VTFTGPIWMKKGAKGAGPPSGPPASKPLVFLINGKKKKTWHTLFQTGRGKFGRPNGEIGTQGGADGWPGPFVRWGGTPNPKGCSHGGWGRKTGGGFFSGGGGGHGGLLFPPRGGWRAENFCRFSGQGETATKNCGCGGGLEGLSPSPGNTPGMPRRSEGLEERKGSIRGALGPGNRAKGGFTLKLVLPQRGNGWGANTVPRPGKTRDVGGLVYPESRELFQKVCSPFGDPKLEQGWPRSTKGTKKNNRRRAGGGGQGCPFTRGGQNTRHGFSREKIFPGGHRHPSVGQAGLGAGGKLFRGGR